MKPTYLEATSVYNGFGQRVATKVNDVWRMFVYDFGGKIVAEYGGPASTNEGSIRYYMQDRQGSTSVVLNQSGFVESRFNYQAFGEEIGANIGMRTTAQGFGLDQSVRNKYAMTERDEASGLDHTWWRKLENQAGRWTSPDPYKGSASIGDPQSFNRYAYVANDPINFADPTGLYSACIHEAMTRVLGEFAGLKKSDIDKLVQYVGDNDQNNSADGETLRADRPGNWAECKVGMGPVPEMHFPSEAQLAANIKSYNTYKQNYNRTGNEEDIKQAAYMIHSIEDGLGAHRPYGTSCEGHAIDSLAGNDPDSVIGDNNFVNAANQVYWAMKGKSNIALSDKHIKELIRRIVEECGKNNVKVIQPGLRGERADNRRRHRRGAYGDRSRQFDWLEIWYRSWRTHTSVRIL